MGDTNATASKPRCRHCLFRVVKSQSRGLCGVCVGNRMIRDLYPAARPVGGGRGYRNYEDHYGGHDLPETPTDSPPASDGRFAVYARRASRGENLHHPNDYRPSDDDCDRDQELELRARIDAANARRGIRQDDYDREDS